MKDVFTTRLTQLFTTGLLAFGLAFTMQVKANDFSQPINKMAKRQVAPLNY
jgi:hypothetical protein